MKLNPESYEAELLNCMVSSCIAHFNGIDDADNDLTCHYVCERLQGKAAIDLACRLGWQRRRQEQLLAHGDWRFTHLYQVYVEPELPLAILQAGFGRGDYVEVWCPTENNRGEYFLVCTLDNIGQNGYAYHHDFRQPAN